MMLDSSESIKGFWFQSPEIFGSEFCKVFTIIPYLVISVLTRLLRLSAESILGPRFVNSWLITANHVRLVQDLKLNDINLMDFSDNFRYHSVLGINARWISFNLYPTPIGSPRFWERG